MAAPKPEETSTVRISDRFSGAFHKFQDQIRERAFLLYLNRKNGEENLLEDWLDAQSELSNPIHLKVKAHKKNCVVQGVLKDFYPSEVEVKVNNNLLQVFGPHVETESSRKSENNGTTANRLTFFQSLPMPTEVDVNKCHAKLLKNREIKVTLPKYAHPRRTS